MSKTCANETVRKLTQTGGPMDSGTNNLHRLVQVVRALAKGRPVTEEQVDEIVAELGTGRDEAEQFPRRVTERDDDTIVGALGLSLKRHPHGHTVKGVRMTAWGALDTLFLPSMLQQAATVESESPLSEEKIRMTVNPEGVQEVSPTGAVMSAVIVDPDNADRNTPTEIQTTFCRMVHFFASREEAEPWAAGRDDIETLSLEAAHDLGSRLWPEAYSYASALSDAS